MKTQVRSLFGVGPLGLLFCRNMLNNAVSGTVGSIEGPRGHVLVSNRAGVLEDGRRTSCASRSWARMDQARLGA